MLTLVETTRSLDQFTQKPKRVCTSKWVQMSSTTYTQNKNIGQMKPHKLTSSDTFFQLWAKNLETSTTKTGRSMVLSKGMTNGKFSGSWRRKTQICIVARLTKWDSTDGTTYQNSATKSNVICNWYFTAAEDNQPEELPSVAHMDLPTTWSTFSHKSISAGITMMATLEKKIS